jgi:hypothetical protein
MAPPILEELTFEVDQFLGGRSRGLSFGAKYPSTTFRGQPCLVGDYAIHIQCPWRIVAGDGQEVAGSNTPSELATTLLAKFLGDDGYIVLGATCGQGGAFRLDLEKDAFVEVTPEVENEDEVWRMFMPRNEEGHFVMYVRGPEGG